MKVGGGAWLILPSSKKPSTVNLSPIFPSVLYTCSRLIYGNDRCAFQGRYRGVVRYRTWHRACVGGLIERQRPMRKGKKIKRGRKGKHLGVLDILSAPNTHLRHGKTPWLVWMGFAIQLKMRELGLWMVEEIKWWMHKSLETIRSSPCVWEPNMQRQYEFLFVLENASQMFDARPRVGGGGRQNKQQLR